MPEYKVNTLGIPGLSNTERVSAPKQKYTQVATGNINPYANKWKVFGEAVSKSLQAATNAMSAVTGYYNYQTNTLQNEIKKSNYFASTVVNDASASALQTTTNLEVSNSKGLIKPGDKLDAYTKSYNDSIGKVTKLFNEGKISENDFNKAKLNIAKTFDPYILNATKEVDSYVRQDNISKLTKTVMATTANQLSNKAFSLKDIVSTNKANAEAFKENGVELDTFKVLTQSLDLFKDNKSVITDRFDEAKHYMQEQITKQKELDPSFIGYLNKLTTYKNAIEARDMRIAKQHNASIKKEANTSLKNYSFNPSNVNASGVVEFGVKNGNRLNYDSLHKTHSIMVEDAIKQITPLAKQAGKTEVEIKALAENKVKKYEVNQFRNYLATHNIYDYPIDMYPKEFKSEARDALKSSIENSLNNGVLADIEESYKYNPITVSKVVQSNLRKDMFSLLTIKDQDSFNQAQESLKQKYGMTPEVLYRGLDNKTRVIYETLLGQNLDIKEFKMRLQELDSVDSKVIKLPMEDDAKQALTKLPISLKDNVEDYFKHKYVAGSIGYVTKDDIDEFVNTHIVKTGIYGFRDSIYIDDGVIKSLGDELSDKTKPLLIKILKNKLPNAKNLDGVTIEDYNGHTHIKKDGVNIISIPTNKFKEEFITLHEQEINNTLKIKANEMLQNEVDDAWNKTVSKNSTWSGESKQGIGLGASYYIDKNTGKKVYKKDFEQSYKQSKEGPSW